MLNSQFNSAIHCRLYSLKVKSKKLDTPRKSLLWDTVKNLKMQFKYTYFRQLHTMFCQSCKFKYICFRQLHTMFCQSCKFKYICFRQLHTMFCQSCKFKYICFRQLHTMFCQSCKGIEFLSQTLILLSLYLCIRMSETFDISNYESF